MTTTTLALILALIPLLPLLAAAVTAFMRNGKRASIVAIAALLASCVLSLIALNEAWAMAKDAQKIVNIPWLEFNGKEIKTEINLGFVLNPLTGCLLYTSPSPRDYAASRMPSSA